MPIFWLATGFLTALLAALLLVPVVRAVAARFGWVAGPGDGCGAAGGEVPTVGGVAIAAAATLAVAVAVGGGRAADAVGALALPGPLVLAGAAVIALVGLWDDLREIGHRTKFAGQLVVTGLAFVGGARVAVFDGTLGGAEAPLALVVSAALTVVWMVGTMNAVNLIDGMDGAAAGVVAIAFAGLAAVHGIGGDVGALVLAVVVVGALVGFLRYNASPASIFMGDSGSLFLGYALAVYALRGTSHAHPALALVIPAVVMGVPVLDTALSIVRRRLGGQPLFAPDRDHIHHRLQARMPTRRAAAALYGFGAFLSLGAAAMAALGVAGALATLAAGTGAVSAFLVYLRYLPAPAGVGALLRRRRRDRQGAEVSAWDGHDRPRRRRGAVGSGGRVGHERFEPVAGPER